MVAALLSLAGLSGVRNGWLDVVNHFAPLIGLLAVAGAVLGWWALEGTTRVVTLGFAVFALLYATTLSVPEMARAWPAGRADGATFRVLSANVWYDNGIRRRSTWRSLVENASHSVNASKDCRHAWTMRLRGERAGRRRIVVEQGQA